jgi:hypothetical protein
MSTDQQLATYIIERKYDLAYLKLTIIIILLIIIIFYITCKSKSAPPPPETVPPAASAPPERFTPSASILIGDIYNSIAGFD